MAEDPAGRMVAWVGDCPEGGSDTAAEIAEALVTGSGRIWRSGRSKSRSIAAGWRALRRAHTRALLGQACGLPDALCRRLRSEDPSAVNRAVREWLIGNEAFAVQLIHSVVAARIAVADAGFSVDERFRAKLFGVDPTAFFDGERRSSDAGRPPGGVDR